MERSRIVFFDRDGIVNRRLVDDYVRRPDQFVFCDGFFPLFEWVKANGFRAIVVSNQQGVGKGIMTAEELAALTEWMHEQIRARCGATFDDVYYCTELDTPDARCRKPRPTMLLDALDKWHGDPSRSWMIGDMPSDVEAGVAAGLRAILVGDYARSDVPGAYAIVSSLAECLQVLQTAAL